MIQEKIDELIHDAMRDKKAAALRTYRAIKTAFTEFKTAKNAKVLDDAAEAQIIRKMIASRQDAARQYELAGRSDLVITETQEILHLIPFLPKPISEDEIREYALSIITDKGMNNMGKYIKTIKEKYPTADGKVIANIVKSLL